MVTPYAVIGIAPASAQYGGSGVLIWPIHHVASVLAIMGSHGTIAGVPWIFQPVAKPPVKAPAPEDLAALGYRLIRTPLWTARPVTSARP